MLGLYRLHMFLLQQQTCEPFVRLVAKHVTSGHRDPTWLYNCFQHKPDDYFQPLVLIYDHTDAIYDALTLLHNGTFPRLCKVSVFNL